MSTINPESGNAILDAWLAFERLSSAQTLGQQGSAFIDLSNAMSQVASWIPGYNYETGTLDDHKEDLVFDGDQILLPAAEVRALYEANKFGGIDQAAIEAFELVAPRDWLKTDGR